MKLSNCFLLFFSLLIQITIGIPTVNAQCCDTSDNASCCNLDVGRPADEGNINQFNMILLHTDVVAFINREMLNYSQPEYKIIGFTFIPQWIEERGNYEVTGLRMALTLRDSRNNILFAGFDCFKHASFPTSDPTYGRLVNQHTLLLTNTISPTSYTGDELTLMENAYDFHYVFLPYREYLNFAMSSKFYTQSQRNGFSNASRGILIERSISGLELTDNPSQICRNDTPGLKTYRSLSFKPYPLPDADCVNVTEADFAFAHGKHCPPYWRDNSDYPDCRALKGLIDNAVPIEEAEQQVRTVYVKPSPSVSLHGGIDLSSPSDSSSTQWYVEFDIEYPLNEKLSLEALFGYYKTAEYSEIYGHSLLLKYYLLRFGKDKPARVYVAGGVGAYGLPEGLETGYVVGSGLNYAINRNVALEAGFQYQRFAAFSNADNTADFLSAKLGIKYSFSGFNNNITQGFIAPSDN